jgi:membrane-associated phospholipid phosphatase
MKSFAKVVNVLLHPVIVTIPGVFLIVYKSTAEIQLALFWTFVSIFFSSTIGLFVMYGVKKGFFTNLDVSNRKQRIILYPFIIAVVLLFVGFVYIVHGPKVLVDASILIILALIILDTINTRIKVSGHVGVLSAFVTGFAYSFGGVSYLSLLLIPLIAWARITEKRHTLKETIVGAICGIGFTLLAIIVIQFLIWT